MSTVIDYLTLFIIFIKLHSEGSVSSLPLPTLSPTPATCTQSIEGLGAKTTRGHWPQCWPLLVRGHAAGALWHGFDKGWGRFVEVRQESCDAVDIHPSTLHDGYNVAARRTDREVDNAIVQTAQVTEKLTAVNVDDTDQTILTQYPNHLRDEERKSNKSSLFILMYHAKTIWVDCFVI